jgi:hypothetical protein
VTTPTSSVDTPLRGIQEGGAYGSKEKSQEEKEKVNSLVVVWRL